MICDAIGILIGTAGMLVGQVVDVTAPSGWGLLMQGGALLVLSVAFLHLIVKTLPKRDQDTLDIMKAHGAAMDRLTDAITQLRVHCAKQGVAEDKHG